VNLFGASNSGELQSRGLVHFSADSAEFTARSLTENMDLTPFALDLQFPWPTIREVCPIAFAAIILAEIRQRVPAGN
jgi:hypothetical protein